MALVQRLNVVSEIDDELIDTYLNKGYNIIDETGRVIIEAIPTDPGQLRIMVAKYKKENEELKTRIVKLEEENSRLKELRTKPTPLLKNKVDKEVSQKTRKRSSSQNK